MTTPESWQLTPREFGERQKVHEKYVEQQARLLATIANAPHFRKSDQSAYTLADFGGPSGPQKKADSIKEQLAMLEMETRLLQPLKAEDVPAWARPEFHRHGGKSNGR